MTPAWPARTHTHSLAQTHKKASMEVSPVSMRDKREINFISFLYEVTHFSLNLQTEYIHIISWIANPIFSIHFKKRSSSSHCSLTYTWHFIFLENISLISLLWFICPSRSKKKQYPLSLYITQLLLFSILYLFPSFFSFSGPIHCLLLL